MSESEKPFTVKDRRHFTPDGEVREVPEEPESGTPADPAPPSPNDSGAADPPASPDPQVDTPAEPAPEPVGPETPETSGTSGTAEQGPPPGAPGGPVDLGQFLFSLGAQASMFLTGQGLPEGADAAEGLAGARSIISIIEMLEAKTEGNRTAEENQVLEGLLYELRMAYLERSRGGGS
jgi:hypothetical protein